MLLQNIQNYYEKLVIEELTERGLLPDNTKQDYVEDIACVALNSLPPQYIRFEVDMGFFMEDEDHYVMHQQVKEALDAAIDFVNHHKNRESPAT